MKAIVRLDVPEFQTGQEVSVYFKDTMCKRGVIEVDGRPKQHKYKETCELADTLAQIANNGMSANNGIEVILIDIAKSLAIIADRMEGKTC